MWPLNSFNILFFWLSSWIISDMVLQKSNCNAAANLVDPSWKPPGWSVFRRSWHCLTSHHPFGRDKAGSESCELLSCCWTSVDICITIKNKKKAAEGLFSLWKKAVFALDFFVLFCQTPQALQLTREQWCAPSVAPSHQWEALCCCYLPQPAVKHLIGPLWMRQTEGLSNHLCVFWKRLCLPNILSGKW